MSKFNRERKHFTKRGLAKRKNALFAYNYNALDAEHTAIFYRYVHRPLFRQQEIPLKGEPWKKVADTMNKKY